MEKAAECCRAHRNAAWLLLICNTVTSTDKVRFEPLAAALPSNIDSRDQTESAEENCHGLSQGHRENPAGFLRRSSRILSALVSIFRHSTMTSDRMLCGCSVDALWMLCGCSVGALWVLCGCSVGAARNSGIHPRGACDPSAVAVVWLLERDVELHCRTPRGTYH